MWDRIGSQIRRNNIVNRRSAAMSALLTSLGMTAIFAFSFPSPSRDVTFAKEPESRCTHLMWPKKRPKQGVVGTRCSRLYGKPVGKVLPNNPPSLGLDLNNISKASYQVSAKATDPDGDAMLYTYSSTGGRINGDGPSAIWDLSGASPGEYTVTAEVDDGCGCLTSDSRSLTVK